MRILFITTGLQMGGAEHQVVDLADRLIECGHDVAIAYLVGEATVLPRSEQVELHPMTCTKTPMGLLRGCMRLRALIRRWQPDVVHSHMVHANLIARVLRLITPMRRLVCTAHSIREGGRLVTWAYRATDCLADISTHVSREAADMFERIGAVPKGRMIPVLNGIDTNLFRGEAALRAQSRNRLFPYAGRRLMLSVGRLVPEKNHAALIRAFAEVVQDYPDVDLWIAGEGCLRSELERECSALGLSDRVVLLGERRDIPELMRAADIVVLSSRIEGFGLVVIEAMASGALVVAADAGGVAEVMDGLEFLVPVDDDTALQHAMVEALSLPSDQAEAMRQAGRQHVAGRFDINRTVDTWLSVYGGIY